MIKKQFLSLDDITHTFVHLLCKGKRPTDLGWIWQVGECSRQPVRNRKQWSETKALWSRRDILDVINSISFILPAHQKDFGLSRKVYRCERRKTGNQGWQTSSGKPALAEQCCSGHTWKSKRHFLKLKYLGIRESSPQN